MAEELQDLRDQVAVLMAENEKLRLDQVQPTASTSARTTTAPVIERLVYIPRDRKCPMFRGHTGISLGEWVEEVEACMRARHLSQPADRAFFLFDHLEGEARNEIKYRASADRENPDKIFSILQDLYGCSDSYVALQEAFFSRKQQEGETLLEFSLALLSLMDRVKARSPNNMPNAEILMRDQFIEHVLDGALRRVLKQHVRKNPAATLLGVRGEAMRWEREGLPACARGRSNSMPSAFGFQHAVQGGPPRAFNSSQAEVSDMKELLKKQQEQLDRLTQSIALLQTERQRGRSPRQGPIICNRCQQPGHIARHCDGPRVPVWHSQSSHHAQPRSGQHSEN